MGVLQPRKLRKNMRCTILVLSLAIIYATASPIADSVVPEDSLYALDDDLLEARQKVDEMVAAGKSDKDCRKLVTDTRTEVTTNAHSCQKILDAMPRGEQCMDLGQLAVESATEAKRMADKHVIHCSNKVTKAANHKVEFGKRTFSSLTEGKCETFFSSATYTSATATYNAAVTAHTKAKGAAGEAAVALKNNIAVAAKAKRECLCKTRADHEKTFATHSASNAANQKAWDFTCKVECVLDGKTNCKCATCPACKRAPLTAAAKEEQCVATRCASANDICKGTATCSTGCPCPKCLPPNPVKCTGKTVTAYFKLDCQGLAHVFHVGVDGNFCGLPHMNDNVASVGGCGKVDILQRCDKNSQVLQKFNLNGGCANLNGAALKGGPSYLLWK